MIDLPKPPFWRSVLSDADNNSYAIARVLTFIVVVAVLVFLVISLPGLSAASLWIQKAKPEDWRALFTTLTGYVPAILIALGTFATGFVALTAHTEPKPPADGQ